MSQNEVTQFDLARQLLKKRGYREVEVGEAIGENEFRVDREQGFVTIQLARGFVKFDEGGQLAAT